ncbi:hypothetical protein BGZ79_003195 [Entomortierella chlamydospora]|nr:hypothetical protein BGZ79_003195 [Entomortierella chlamydospora]
MRLSIASIALLAVSILGVASAKSSKTAVGICSCFNPKFDASCCIPVKGYMEKDGNVCMTTNPDKTIPMYQACCARSGGKSKCKHGIQDYPPSDSYSCKA